MKRYAEYMARLIPVVFVVAGGQALSLFFLSYITNNYAISEINAVANIDAAFSLMLGLSTIGIGQHYSRKLLISDDFEYYLTEARSVRLLIGGSISLLGVALLSMALFFFQELLLVWALSMRFMLKENHCMLHLYRSLECQVFTG